MQTKNATGWRQLMLIVWFSSTTLDSPASGHHNPNLPTPANHHSAIPANHHAATPANHHNHSDRLHVKHNPPRPASADQHKFVNKVRQVS